MDKIIQLVAALSAGLAVTCLALCVLQLLARVELERHGKGTEEFNLPIPLLFRLLRPFLPLVRTTAESEALASWRNLIAPKLLMAGYGEVFTPGDFLGLKLLIYGLGLVILIIGVLSGRVLICLCMAILIVMFYSSMWLSMRIKARHLSIMKALPNVLDLLTLSVESGRDIVSALRDILTRRRMDALGEELTRAFRQMQLGRKRADALRDMAQRVQQPDLTTTVNAIVQAEEMGVSIVQLLRVQGDMQRNKRFTLAEKLANEASVKIIFPVVFFILPSVIIVIFGPLALQVLQMFSR